MLNFVLFHVGQKAEPYETEKKIIGIIENTIKKRKLVLYGMKRINQKERNLTVSTESVK